MGRRAGRRRPTRREKIAKGRTTEDGRQKTDGRRQMTDSEERDVEKTKYSSISPETRIMMALIRNRYGLRLNEILI